MGKSVKGKELGKGISQRKDGLYQARFFNRFGKRQTLYDKTYNGIIKKMRDEQYNDEKEITITSKSMTLDEWFDIWMETCKKNCRNNSKQSYSIHYNRIKDNLGWRKLSQLNLVIMQDAINNLNSDNERKNSKKILVDMINKAMDTDLIAKNVAKQINTVVSKENKKERRVLTKDETKLFLHYAKTTVYYQLYVVALETGMRIGELSGLKWSDIDFSKRVINVKHSMCYFQKDDNYVYELHDVKTQNGFRNIPLTSKAVVALKEQYLRKQNIINHGKEPLKDFNDLVFATRNNKPVTVFLVTESLKATVNRINKDKPNLNFERLTPHTFRHTFATRLIELGVQPKTVQKLLGHGTLQITMDLYCHVTQDTLFEEMEKYERATS